jgi:hypothetical protein
MQQRYVGRRENLLSALNNRKDLFLYRKQSTYVHA